MQVMPHTLTTLTCLLKHATHCSHHDGAPQSVMAGGGGEQHQHCRNLAGTIPLHSPKIDNIYMFFHFWWTCYSLFIAGAILIISSSRNQEVIMSPKVTRQKAVSITMVCCHVTWLICKPGWAASHPVWTPTWQTWQPHVCRLWCTAWLHWLCEPALSQPVSQSCHIKEKIKSSVHRQSDKVNRPKFLILKAIYYCYHC